MITLSYTAQINAPIAHVWDVMLHDTTYRIWTKPFHENSYYEGSWEQGSEIRFLAQEEDGKIQGMFSKIKTNKKHELIVIEHLGMVKDGIVDTESDEVKSWAGAKETYHFVEENGSTILTVDTQSDLEYAQTFNEMWPNALDLLKELAE